MGWYLHTDGTLDQRLFEFDTEITVTGLHGGVMFLYLTRKELMSARLGTRGDVQVTSMLSEPTRPKRRSVGAGTANVKKEKERD